MATSSLPRKLQMKAGQRALILNAPADYLDQLGPLPEGVELAGTPEDTFDFVQLFVKNMDNLEQLLPTAMQAVKHDAMLWIAYPKGGAKAGTDLNRDILHTAVAKRNLIGVSLVSLDEIWSAMRFRPAEKVGK